MNTAVPETEEMIRPQFHLTVPNLRFKELGRCGGGASDILKPDAVFSVCVGMAIFLGAVPHIIYQSFRWR